MFEAAVDALACALRIQAEIGRRNELLPEPRRIAFRIGLNLGDVILDRGDMYGNGVNVAARLEALAEPGGICVSESVRTAVGQKLALHYEDLGAQALKNLDAPVRAFKVRAGSVNVTPALAPASPAPGRLPKLWLMAVAAVLVLAVVALLTVPFLREDTPVVDSTPMPQAVSPVAVDANEATQPAPLPNSVAVLPFENMSPDPNNAYFADGLHEEVLNQLAKIKALNVIARTTMRQYANTDKSFRQIADELNVETVMEGSVRYADNYIRVTVQLINPATGVHSWSEAYDREQKHIFAVQTDIALKVAVALAANFSLAEREAIERVPTQSPEAYALYLEASALVLRLTLNDLTLALEKINQALELDPEFAMVWALKSRLHNLAVIFFPQH